MRLASALAEADLAEFVPELPRRPRQRWSGTNETSSFAPASSAMSSAVRSRPRKCLADGKKPGLLHAHEEFIDIRPDLLLVAGKFVREPFD